jgi:hypothetical protein
MKKQADSEQQSAFSPPRVCEGALVAKPAAPAQNAGFPKLGNT